jgi:hypothetical protein
MGRDGRTQEKKGHKEDEDAAARVAAYKRF